MHTDLDDLLETAQGDALLVVGPARHNPAMVYLTGMAHIGEAVLVKRRGRAPRLYVFPLEREEAARTGLEVRVLERSRFSQPAKGDTVEMLALLFQHVLADQDVAGQVRVYGRRESGETYGALRRVEQRMPNLTLVGESLFSSVLGQARVTKDSAEVERIRQMGRVTVEVVDAVVDRLTSGYAADGYLVNGDGQPVTVGETKRLISVWLSERGADNPQGTILSVGRDTGIPHSAGLDDDLIPIGRPILLDLFPCEAGGGYFHDFTRTWCLGHAPDPMAKVYDLVLDAYRQSLASMRPGVTAQSLQARVCDLFEAQGHPTIRSHPGTQAGYVHSLGHGVGLDIHELPALRLGVEGEMDLRPGMVMAVEPGLYYPEENMGVRLEDTVWLRPDGKPEVLAAYPMDLVLPVRSKRKAYARPKGDKRPRRSKP